MSKEIRELKRLKKQQETYLSKIIEKEKKTLSKMERAIDKMI